MIFIAENCTGCRSCQLACSLHHVEECGPSLARLAAEAEGLRLSIEFVPDCDGCALCAEHCPYGAIEEGD